MMIMMMMMIMNYILLQVYDHRHHHDHHDHPHHHDHHDHHDHDHDHHDHLSPAIAAMVRTEATIARWVMKAVSLQKKTPKTQFLEITIEIGESVKNLTCFPWKFR